MDLSYTAILILVLILSPLILIFASRQGKRAKQNVKNIFLTILLSQILLGFFNWENFSVGRSGYELSFSFPGSLLGLFFIISTFQIFLLLINNSFNTLVVVLNFINTILIFTGMIKLSGILGYQAASLSSIGTVFLVLTGNIAGLAFINKDKNLLKKYLR